MKLCEHKWSVCNGEFFFFKEKIRFCFVRIGKAFDDEAKGC